MAKSIKDRLFERLPGTRTATEDTRPKQQADVGLPQKISGFLREFKTEMKKVTWPSRKETVSSTAVGRLRPGQDRVFRPELLTHIKRT